MPYHLLLSWARRQIIGFCQRYALFALDNEQLFCENSDLCFFTKLQETRIWTDYQQRSLPLPTHGPSANCLSASSELKQLPPQLPGTVCLHRQPWGEKRQLTLPSEAGQSGKSVSRWRKGVSECDQTDTASVQSTKCPEGICYTLGTPQHKDGGDSMSLSAGAAAANSTGAIVSRLAELQCQGLQNNNAFILILHRLSTPAVFRNVSTSFRTAKHLSLKCFITEQSVILDSAVLLCWLFFLSTQGRNPEFPFQLDTQNLRENQQTSLILLTRAILPA